MGGRVAAATVGNASRCCVRSAAQAFRSVKKCKHRRKFPGQKRVRMRGAFKDDFTVEPAHLSATGPAKRTRPKVRGKAQARQGSSRTPLATRTPTVINPNPTAVEIRRPCGSAFSANTTRVSESIQAILIIPTAVSTANGPSSSQGSTGRAALPC